MITEKSVVEVSDSLTVANLDGEAVILDMSEGRYYGLNKVGARVLELMKEPISVSSILERVGESYEVEREQVKTDLLSFLQQMADRQLVHIKNGTHV